MSSTVTTRANDPQSWRETLRAAAGELVAEEAEALIARDDAGVVLDRRCRAHCRRTLRRAGRPVGAAWRRAAAVLLLAALPTGILLAHRADTPTADHAGDATKSAVAAISVTSASTAEDKTVDRTREAWLISDLSLERLHLTQNGVSCDLHYTVPTRQSCCIYHIASARNHVTIPGPPSGEPWQYCSAALDADNFSAPNAISLTVGEGIGYLRFDWSVEEPSEISDLFPKLEVLKLPASLKCIFYQCDLMKLRLVQDITELEPSCSGSGADFWRVVKEQTGYGALYFTFPLDLAELRMILVEEGNEDFWDEEGMLYGNSFVRLEVAEDEYPTRQLICLPQSYGNTTEMNGKVRVDLPDGTDYIHTGAVYHCRIDYLYIPASVTRIAPAAIMATSERPLTVIGQRGSAAEEYVRQFGQKYNLVFLAEPAS